MEPFLGQIQAFGFNFAPRGWAKCEGQLLAISQYNALFALLGTTYGGDGRTSFALPDLRGRSIVGVGSGPGLSNISQGQKLGFENATLAVNNLPAHNHPVTVKVNTGAGEEPNASSYIANHAGAFQEEPTANAFLAGTESGNTGGNQAFNIRNPVLGLNVCIAVQGIFPSRN